MRVDSAAAPGPATSRRDVRRHGADAGVDTPGKEPGRRRGSPARDAGRKPIGRDWLPPKPSDSPRALPILQRRVDHRWYPRARSLFTRHTRIWSIGGLTVLSDITGGRSCKALPRARRPMKAALLVLRL